MPHDATRLALVKRLGGTGALCRAGVGGVARPQRGWEPGWLRHALGSCIMTCLGLWRIRQFQRQCKSQFHADRNGSGSRLFQWLIIWRFLILLLKLPYRLLSPDCAQT